jgi:hypothetical protein
MSVAALSAAIAALTAIVDQAKALLESLIEARNELRELADGGAPSDEA